MRYSLQRCSQQSPLCCFRDKQRVTKLEASLHKLVCAQELLPTPQKRWCTQVIAARVDTGLDVEVTYSYKVGPLMKGSGASPHHLTCILELSGHAPTGMHGTVLKYGSMADHVHLHHGETAFACPTL